MPRDAEEEKYFMEGNADELQRLTCQHEVIKAHVGKLILAPLDLSKPGLRILDSATADGMWASASICTMHDVGIMKGFAHWYTRPLAA